MSSRIVIEQIVAEETLREGATVADLRAVEQFASASRRREVLAWRAIVRRELGETVAISHDEYGAPRVDVPNLYISVSHSRDRVAVLFADRRCAVDVESAERDFCKVASRYLSDKECQIAQQYGLYAEMWSAKEALYKYHRKGGLDLVRDITISSYEPGSGVLKGSIRGGETIDVKVKRESNLVVAVID